MLAQGATANSGEPSEKAGDGNNPGTIIPEIVTVLVAGAFGALLTFYFRDRPAERWKRTEYVRKAFQERYDSPGAKNASFLLYWQDRHIPLWDDDEENRWERVTDREAAKAILPYVVHPLRFEDHNFKRDKRRIALNDSFVDLIWRLDHVRVAADAAKPEDVHEVIREVGELLDGKRDATHLAPGDRLIPSAFRLMLGWRKMHRLIQFFDRQGYDIRVTQSDIDLLKDAFPELDWTKLPIERLKGEVPIRAPHWRVQVLQELDRTRVPVTTFSWMITSARVLPGAIYRWVRLVIAGKWEGL